MKITASSWNCWDSTWPSWPPDPTEIGLRRQKPRFVFNQLGFPVKLQVNKTGSWKIGVHGLVIELEYRGQYVDSVAGKIHIFWEGQKNLKKHRNFFLFYLKSDARYFVVKIKVRCDFIMIFLAISYLLEISHVKTFKMIYQTSNCSNRINQDCLLLVYYIVETW